MTSADSSTRSPPSASRARALPSTTTTRGSTSAIHCRSGPRNGAITTTVTLDGVLTGPRTFSDPSPPRGPSRETRCAVYREVPPQLSAREVKAAGEDVSKKRAGPYGGSYAPQAGLTLVG